MEKATEIKLPEPLNSILFSCEVLCVADCCGLRAFEFDPKWVRLWIEDNDVEQLSTAERQIDELISSLSDTPGEIYFVVGTNETDAAEGWIESLSTLRVAVEKAPSIPLPKPRKPRSHVADQLLETTTLLGCGLLGAAPVVALIFVIQWLLRHRQP